MNRLRETFFALVEVDSPSFEERLFCKKLKELLKETGVLVYEDDAGSRIGGNCGNLYGFWPGSRSLPPLLLSAHMDTVEPGRGKKAVVDKDGVITSAGETILGADDAAGVAIILESLLRLKESGVPHRPVEVLFPVAEERYGLGSGVFDYSRIKSKESYTLDLSGAIGEAANAAPTIMSFEIEIIGKAAHAGFAPKDGIHAIAAAAKAAARVPLGEPEPGVTVNIGKIKGGKAGNIVPDSCVVVGEIRSLSHIAVTAWWDRVRGIFEEEAKLVGASEVSKHRFEVTAYETPLESPVVKRFERACAKAGVLPNIRPTLGGSDQNNFALHGIQGIVIACSMHDVHSTREFSRQDEMERCVELVLAMLTDD